MFKYVVILAGLVFGSLNLQAQQCDCEKGFDDLKSFIEKNYAGFQDKKKEMTDKGYQKLVNEYQTYSRSLKNQEQCLLVLSAFLDQFKDSHLSIRGNADPTKVDSAYVKQRRIIRITDKQIAALRKSKSFEGIYDFHEGKYKIAVIKDKTKLYEYVGVIINSPLPGWKRGMVKFEAKMKTDSIGKGALYMLNHRPKIDYFYFGHNYIGGDWQREGTTKEPISYNYVPVAAKKLSTRTFYLKISNFSPSNANNIDSIIKANAEALENTPNLILDLRGNSGGADFTFQPLLPLLYTDPISYYGVDLRSTPANIAGWKKYLDEEDLPESNIGSIKETVSALEAQPQQWVHMGKDGVISDFSKRIFPKKVVILIDESCASTTEQFLLFAKASSKVTLLGQRTSGTLDYSNVIAAPFSCMPYTLRYSSSRSRRLDHNLGIDKTGIKPDLQLKDKSDWIQQALMYLEAQHATKR